MLGACGCVHVNIYMCTYVCTYTMCTCTCVLACTSTAAVHAPQPEGHCTLEGQLHVCDLEDRYVAGELTLFPTLSLRCWVGQGEDKPLRS